MISFKTLAILGALAVAAVLVVAILVALGWKPSREHDGPWSFGAVLLSGLSLAPMSPADQPMSAGCGWPLAATIARSGATYETGDFPGRSGGAAPVLGAHVWIGRRAAQGEAGPCLPWLLPGVASGPTKGNAPRTAAAPATAGPGDPWAPCKRPGAPLSKEVA